jgi:predicted DNA-binding helix-hairpin-helix protein
MQLAKLRHLSYEARYDRHALPIYWAAARGRRVPLLKTLVTNFCKSNCTFCVNRRSRRCPRYRFEVEELVDLALELRRRGLIEGVFLSSGISKDPDWDTLQEVKIARLLRQRGFLDYIHLRLMPGCSLDLIKQAAQVADRIGINLEAPNKEIFQEIKIMQYSYKEDVLRRMRWISRVVARLRKNYPKSKFGLCRAGIDTQLVVGAVEDNDRAYLKRTHWLYQKLGLARVYFSGFEPVERTPLEENPSCPKQREHRLYQASFLIRDYKFSFKKFVYDEEGNLLEGDPKLRFAEFNPEIYPISINKASYQQLLLVPGIGPGIARKIIACRPIRSLKHLQRIAGRKLSSSLKYLEIPGYRYIKLSDFLVRTRE